MTDWKEKYKEKKYTEIIDMFLKDGASPNIRTDDKDSKTLLYLAVNTENVNLVRTILDAGADPNLQNEGYIPLTGACEEIDLEIMELLLEHGATPNSENNGEPNLSWIFGSDEPISKKLNGTKLLLKYGYDLNQTDIHGDLDRSIFDITDNDDNIEIIKLLLSHGLNPNNEKFTNNILNIPSEKGAVEIVKLLLDMDTDPNKIYKYTIEMPLKHAAKNNNIEIVKLLLDRGADPNIAPNNDVPLLEAIDNQNLEIMLLLLDGGADPYYIWMDQYSEKKYSMLQYAKIYRKNRALQLLESYILEKEIEQNTIQRLATGEALDPRLGEDSVLGYIDEPSLFEQIASHIPEYNSRYAPDVSRRMMSEKEQTGKGKYGGRRSSRSKHGKKLSKRKIRNNYRFY